MANIKFSFRSLGLQLFITTGSLLRLLFPSRVRSLISEVRKIIYTSLLSTEFKELASRTSISKGLTLVGGQYIAIKEKCSLGKSGVLTAWSYYANEFFSPEIIIGANCSIGDYFHVSAVNSIRIGENVLIGRWVTIVDNAHGEINKDIILIAPIKRKLYSKGPIVISDNVWIGDKSTVLAGVTIGRNSIVGANSVVTRDVPPNCIVAGSPAKIIKMIL